jgi:hypothetical protein
VQGVQGVRKVRKVRKVPGYFAAGEIVRRIAKVATSTWPPTIVFCVPSAQVVEPAWALIVLSRLAWLVLVTSRS